jgi:NADH dehydrogenase
LENFKYDYLVIATGSKTNYFGNKEIERNSMAMKTIPQSILESDSWKFWTSRFNYRCSRTKQSHQFCTRRWRTNRSRACRSFGRNEKPFCKRLSDLDIAKMQINLIQSGDRILNTMSEKSSQAAEEFLTSLGVKSGKMFV